MSWPYGKGDLYIYCFSKDQSPFCEKKQRRNKWQQNVSRKEVLKHYILSESLALLRWKLEQLKEIIVALLQPVEIIKFYQSFSWYDSSTDQTGLYRASSCWGYIQIHSNVNKKTKEIFEWPRFNLGKLLAISATLDGYKPKATIVLHSKHAHTVQE